MIDGYFCEIFKILFLLQSLMNYCVIPSGGLVFLLQSLMNYCVIPSGGLVFLLVYTKTQLVTH